MTFLVNNVQNVIRNYNGNEEYQKYVKTDQEHKKDKTRETVFRKRRPLTSGL